MFIGPGPRAQDDFLPTPAAAALDSTFSFYIKSHSHPSGFYMAHQCS